MKINNHYSCSNGMCPGLLLTDRNTVVIQGAILTQGDKAQRTVPGHEDVVEIHRGVFAILLGQYGRG